MPVLQGTILILSLVFVATNLVVDLLQSLIDPRIRAEPERCPDTAILHSPPATFDEQAAPATRVRGYWQSVGYRLRHDPVTLFFGAVVLLIVLAAIFAPLTGAVRSLQGKHRRAAEAVRLARPPARHRRTRPRHAEPADLRRARRRC